MHTLDTWSVQGMRGGLKGGAGCRPLWVPCANGVSQSNSTMNSMPLSITSAMVMEAIILRMLPSLQLLPGC